MHREPECRLAAGFSVWEEFMREWLFSFNLASNEVWVRRARRTHGAIGTLEGR